MNELVVSFTNANGFCVPHTSWTLNDKVVVHGVSDDTFLCCMKETGEVLKETKSLSDALSWLQNN